MLDNRQDYRLGELLQYENVAWYEDGKVRILDRRVYPAKKEFVECCSYKEVVDALRDMVTQSAGPYTAAGMGMVLAAYESEGHEQQLAFLEQAALDIGNARPTTSKRMLKITTNCLQAGKKAIEAGTSPIDAIFEHVIQSLNQRYSRMNVIGSNLFSLLSGKKRVLTHCFGETNIAMLLRNASDHHHKLQMYCSETRPFFQGARLTSSLVVDQGHEAFVFSDNMVASMIENNQIEAFISAADTICMDGSVINKVGTLQIAILAKHYGIPYFVTGIPDAGVINPAHVEIEYRDEEELLVVNQVRNTKPGVKGLYPSFDVAPAHLVSAVVTDKGVYAPHALADYYKQAYEEFF